MQKRCKYTQILQIYFLKNTQGNIYNNVQCVFFITICHQQENEF